jgi:plastocyanin
MNRRAFAALPALVVLAAVSVQAQQRPVTPAAPAAQGAGTVIRVRMMQQGSRYVYEPANFTVRQGDIVEFVNVNGLPHNVQFEPAKIPAGAADVLNRNMPNRLGPLQSPMFTQPNQTYRISFAGAPVGTYEYFCLPHKALNMKGVITVTAAARR